jgi:TRAP-type uncharacterized transport system substrate-binding protein
MMWLRMVLSSIIFFGVPSLAFGEDDRPTVIKPNTPVLAPPLRPSVGQSATLKPRVRICTAQSGNNYHRYGMRLAELLKDQAEVVVIDTRGSWENLEMIDANPRRCDAIIAQDDAHALHHYERPNSNLTVDRTATLYPEYAHLLCHRSIKANRLADLDPETHAIIVNEYGSGSFITWKLFQRLNADYKRFKTIEKNIDEGILRALDPAQPACLFFVSGLGGRTLATADQTFGDQLKLIAIDDPKLTRKVGRPSRQIYQLSSITANTYKRLTSTALTTPSVGAVFFMSPEWRARYPRTASQVAAALLKVIAASRQ